MGFAALAEACGDSPDAFAALAEACGDFPEVVAALGGWCGDWPEGLAALGGRSGISRGLGAAFAKVEAWAAEMGSDHGALFSPAPSVARAFALGLSARRHPTAQEEATERRDRSLDFSASLPARLGRRGRRAPVPTT